LPHWTFCNLILGVLGGGRGGGSKIACFLSFLPYVGGVFLSFLSSVGGGVGGGYFCRYFTVAGVGEGRNIKS
jgi:hypothetical protein